jgi:hypothetical protein
MALAIRFLTRCKITSFARPTSTLFKYLSAQVPVIEVSTLFSIFAHRVFCSNLIPPPCCFASAK